MIYYNLVKLLVRFTAIIKKSVVLVNFYEGQRTINETNNINKTSLGCTPQYIVTYE